MTGMTMGRAHTFLICILLVFCAMQGFASAEQRGKASVYSPGTVSCGLWLDARASAGQTNDIRLLQLEAFVYGFATAYNFYVPGSKFEGKRDVLHVDGYAIDAFLDQYCRENSTQMFVHAVTALLEHLDKATSGSAGR